MKLSITVDVILSAISSYMNFEDDVPFVASKLSEEILSSDKIMYKSCPSSSLTISPKMYHFGFRQYVLTHEVLD